MHQYHGNQQLKTGETLQLFSVTGPDEIQGPRALSFLKHKSDLWQWQLSQALAGPLDGLETRFYLGEIEGAAVGNICTFESRGVGILGHVFTAPDHRRKGIAEALMAAVTEDFHRRGGRFMTLGTGYDSPPYHLYRRFGFVGIESGSGAMRWDTEPGFAVGALEPGPTAARPMRWDDWPWLNILSFETDRPVLRLVSYGVSGHANLEWAGIKLLRDRSEDARQGVWVLENTQTRAVVGLASISRDPLWKQSWILNLWVAPAFAESAATLLEAIQLPEGKVLCYLEPGPEPIPAALGNAGFVAEGMLRRQVRWQGRELDIEVWGRSINP